MARRVMPPAIVVTLALGWLRLLGQRVGLFGLEMGTGLLVVIFIRIRLRPRCTLVHYTTLFRPASLRG